MKKYDAHSCAFTTTNDGATCDSPFVVVNDFQLINNLAAQCFHLLQRANRTCAGKPLNLARSTSALSWFTYVACLRFRLNSPVASDIQPFSSFALYVVFCCMSIELNYAANSTPLQCIVVGLVYLVERISTRHQLIQLELAIFIQS